MTFKPAQSLIGEVRKNITKLQFTIAHVLSIHAPISLFLLIDLAEQQVMMVGEAEQ